MASGPDLQHAQRVDEGARGRSRRRATLFSLLGATLVCGAVAAGLAVLLLRRWLAADARRVAASLIACPVEATVVESISSGWSESWHVEGCGARGTMFCELTDPKCSWVSDPR
jgi:hypothetical protein